MESCRYIDYADGQQESGVLHLAFYFVLIAPFEFEDLWLVLQPQ